MKTIKVKNNRGENIELNLEVEEVDGKNISKNLNGRKITILNEGNIRFVDSISGIYSSTFGKIDNVKVGEDNKTLICEKADLKRLKTYPIRVAVNDDTTRNGIFKIKYL